MAERKSTTKSTPSPNGRRPYAVRKSEIAGKGAFATRSIKKGTRIAEYTGEVISSAESDRRYPEVDDGTPHHTFLFELDDEMVVDATYGGNSSKFINHSCDPNCEAVIEDDHIYIEALKNIKEGQELLYDYNYIMDERHSPALKRRYPCHCGARNCRGTILGKKR